MLARTGVFDQIDQYLGARPGGQADANTLYLLWSGANDFTAGNDSQASQLQALASNRTALATLAAAGAQSFLLVNNGGNRPAFNNGLAAAALDLEAGLGVDVLFYNLRAQVISWFANPTAFGFDPAHVPPPGTGASVSCLATLGCVGSGQENTYIYWDSTGHLTTRAHQLVGQGLASLVAGSMMPVPEPASAALLAVALGVFIGFGWLRRRSLAQAQPRAMLLHLVRS